MSRETYQNQPCGYCGKNTGPEGEAEHVVPKCLYTSLVAPKLRRLTIPACPRCNDYWSKYESTFRDLCVSMGTNETAHHRELAKKIERSFLGRGAVGERARDRIRRLEVQATDPGGNPVQHVAPFREPSFILVQKKIVRGLCYSHRREIIKSNDRVFVLQEFDRHITYNDLTTVYEVPEVFKARAVFFKRAPGDNLHSVWVLDFLSNWHGVLGVWWRVERKQDTVAKD